MGPQCSLPPTSSPTADVDCGEFLDRAAARPAEASPRRRTLDRGAGRPRGVEGFMETAPHWPDRVQIGLSRRSSRRRMFSRTPCPSCPTENQVGVPVLRTRKTERKIFRYAFFLSIDRAGLIGVRHFCVCHGTSQSKAHSRLDREYASHDSPNFVR